MLNHLEIYKMRVAMAKIPRILVKGEDAIYHVILRTTLEGYVIGDVEKDYLLKIKINLRIKSINIEGSHRFH